MLFLVIGSIVCLGAASEYTEYNEYSSYPAKQYGSHDESEYDNYGYDKHGYDNNGYDKNGYDKNGHGKDSKYAYKKDDKHMPKDDYQTYPKDKVGHVYPASHEYTADEYTVYSSDHSQQYGFHPASNKKSSYKSDMNSHLYDRYDNSHPKSYPKEKNMHTYTDGKYEVPGHYDNEHYGCRSGSLHCQCNKYGAKCDKHLFCNDKTYRCEDTLYTKLAAYPGYKEGAGYISGEVEVTAIVAEKKYDDHYDHYGAKGTKLCDNNATTLVIKWNLKGQSKYMDPAYMGGLQINDGHTCSYGNQVGGPFWCGYSDPMSNPWRAVHWSSNRGTVNVQVGLSLSEVVGRTLVITRDNGQKLACGVLKPPVTKTPYYP